MNKDFRYFSYTGIEPRYIAEFHSQLLAYAASLRNAVATLASNRPADALTQVQGVRDDLLQRYGIAVRGLDLLAVQPPASIDDVHDFASALCFLAEHPNAWRDRHAFVHQWKSHAGGFLAVRFGKETVPAPLDTMGWFTAADKLGGGWPQFAGAAGAPLQPVIEAMPDLLLTQAQREISCTLASMYRIRGSGRERVAGVWSRPFPLVLGPTGAGKTTIVRHLAAAMRAKLATLYCGAWVVTGAYRQPSTLESLRTLVRSGRGIIFIDELEKFSATTDWALHVQQDVMALLDGRLDGVGWSDDEIRALGGWLIVGAATYHDLCQQARRSVGFHPAFAGAGVEAVRRQHLIPPELLARFSDNWLVLAHPTVSDILPRIREIHIALGIPIPESEDLVELAQAAVESALGMRWLERYLMGILTQQDSAEAGAAVETTEQRSCPPDIGAMVCSPNPRKTPEVDREPAILAANRRGQASPGVPPASRARTRPSPSEVANQHASAFFLKGRAKYLREAAADLSERVWTALMEKSIGKALSHLRGEAKELARTAIRERMCAERRASLARLGKPPTPVQKG